MQVGAGKLARLHIASRKVRAFEICVREIGDDERRRKAYVRKCRSGKIVGTIVNFKILEIALTRCLSFKLVKFGHLIGHDRPLYR